MICCRKYLQELYYKGHHQLLPELARKITRKEETGYTLCNHALLWYSGSKIAQEEIHGNNVYAENDINRIYTVSVSV